MVSFANEIRRGIPRGIPRFAGSEIGQVPQTTNGRLKDLKTLQSFISEAESLCKQNGIRYKPMRSPLKIEDIKEGKLIAEFTLAPDSLTSFPPKNQLLPIPHMKNQGKSIQPPTLRSVAIDDQDETCSRIHNNQRSKRVQLRYSNLLTLFEGRWLDSVVIDAMIHVLQEHFPLKRFMYINSAEKDPTMEELKLTRGCSDMVLSVLWLKSHWSCIAINHRRKRIRYLNSQLLSQETAIEQTKPFIKYFPDYTVVTHSPSQQNNGYDCGIYSIMSIHLLMYYDENEVERITPADATKYRHSILMQLLISFLLAQ
jgi:hypothetical protein